MAESTPINIQAFSPFKGGRGKRLAVSTSSARIAIPGLSGGLPAPNARVLVTNPNSVSVFVVMGNDGEVADLDCLELLAGNAYLLTPPTAGPGGIWLAAIVVSGTMNISVCGGEGA